MEDASKGGGISLDGIGRARSTWPRVLSKNYCGAVGAQSNSVVWFLQGHRDRLSLSREKSKYGNKIMTHDISEHALEFALVIDS